MPPEARFVARGLTLGLAAWLDVRLSKMSKAHSPGAVCGIEPVVEPMLRSSSRRCLRSIWASRAAADRFMR